MAVKKPRFDSAKRVAQRHPWITGGTIVAIVTVIGIVMPGVYFVANHYQTVDDARAHAIDDLISRSYLQLSIGNNAALFIDRSVRNAKIKKTVDPNAFTPYDAMVLEADENALVAMDKKMEPIRKIISDLSAEKAKGK